MRTKYLALAAVCLAATSPLAAQMADAPALSAEQEAERAAWPDQVQTYYDTLTGEQQALFWRLTDDDKVKLAAMSPEQQVEAWDVIEDMANGAAPAAEPPPASDTGPDPAEPDAAIDDAGTGPEATD